MSCNSCLGTGWAFLPHSDQSRQRCDCRAGRALVIPPTVRHCAKCAQLEEENAYLRSELGHMADAQTPATLSERYGLTPLAAKLLEALHLAKGRVVDKARLLEMVGSMDECGRGLDMQVHQIRKRLGSDAVITIRSMGLKIGPSGSDAMREIAA